MYNGDVSLVSWVKQNEDVLGCIIVHPQLRVFVNRLNHINHDLNLYSEYRHVDEIEGNFLNNQIFAIRINNIVVGIATNRYCANLIRDYVEIEQVTDEEFLNFNLVNTGNINFYEPQNRVANGNVVNVAQIEYGSIIDEQSLNNLLNRMN